MLAGPIVLNLAVKFLLTNLAVEFIRFASVNLRLRVGALLLPQDDHTDHSFLQTVQECC